MRMKRKQSKIVPTNFLKKGIPLYEVRKRLRERTHGEHIDRNNYFIRHLRPKGGLWSPVQKIICDIVEEIKSEQKLKNRIRAMKR